MALCSGRLAEAWEYAAFWCQGILVTGAHDGANGAAALSDADVGFVDVGVQPNVGMVLYNLTKGTSGPVTAVGTHTLTAAGVTWDAGDAFRTCLITGVEIANIEHWLTIASADVQVALHASGQCDCTPAPFAATLLKKLTIIDAATYYQCKCRGAVISNELRLAYIEQMSTVLGKLASGELTICQGETGKNFPALGWAEQGVTEWNRAEIIWNDILRKLGG